MADSLPKGSDGKPIGKIVEIEYDVVDLPAWDFDKLVGGVELRLALGILKKMIEGDGDDFPAAMLPLREISDEEQKIELTRELLGFVASAFAAHNRRIDEAVLSRALKPIFKEKERTMIKTIFEEREAIGETRAVLAVLRARFTKVPKGIETAVRKMTDSTALESLAAHAATCQSLDEFAKSLK